MRYGFTTGSCAAAVAKAGTYMLLTGTKKEQIQIMTPKGIPYNAKLLDIQMKEHRVVCAVEKDGGDDPDITSGMYVYGTVQMIQEQGNQPELIITGGKGVGKVTKPGLDQPVGAYAINHVPREMIEKEVREVCEMLDFTGTLKVVIEIPEGEQLAKKTFNPRLGIEGGLSILGTSGIVEPMSSQALIDTIRTELNVVKASGNTMVAITPGNYGLDFMKETYQFDLEQSVKCSNYIGITLDAIKELGFQKVLLTGHIGKLIKVAGGIMNTHSKEADCRMELLVSAGVMCDVPVDVLKEMLHCITTTSGLHLLVQCGKLEAVMNCLMEKIMFYLHQRVGEAYQIECIMYENSFGELGRSKGAIELLEEMRG